MSKDSKFRVFGGSLGSYKSYHGVIEMLETLKNGGIIYTNIPLNWERIKLFIEDTEGLILENHQYVQIDYSNASKFVDLVKRGTFEQPGRAVIDEAAIHYDSRDRRVDDLTLQFVVHLRKLHVDTIFIAHDFEEIHKRLRNKAQSFTVFRDLQKVKKFGIYLPFPFYTACEKDARDPRIIYESQLNFKNKKIYQLYTSHDVQTVEMASIQDAPKTVLKTIDRPKKKNPFRFIFKYAVIFLLVFLVSRYSSPQAEAILIHDESISKVPVKELKKDDVHSLDEEEDLPFITGYLVRGIKRVFLTSEGQKVHLHEVEAFNYKEVVLKDGTVLNRKYNSSVDLDTLVTTLERANDLRVARYNLTLPVEYFADSFRKEVESEQPSDSVVAPIDSVEGVSSASPASLPVGNTAKVGRGEAVAPH